MHARHLAMNNDRDFYSPGRDTESHPAPAPSPQVGDEGIPLPHGTPRRHLPLLPSAFSTPRPHLHPLLSYANRPGVAYDVRERPSSASTRHGRLEWAREPATNLPSPGIIITRHTLPRQFVTLPSESRSEIVTVHDTLLAVHSAFSQAMRPAEDPRNHGPWANRPGETPATLLSERLERPGALSERYTWKGMSEETFPGNWLLRIERGGRSYIGQLRSVQRSASARLRTRRRC